jgi:hypothetical protein
LAVTRPAITFIAPYQSVCNYSVYFFAQLSEVFSPVQKGPSGGGTILQNGLKLPNSTQANNYGTSNTSRPVDIPTTQSPIGAKDSHGDPLHRLYAQPYPQAIDAQGNADCQAAQVGYVKGPFGSNARYPRGQLSDGTPMGANWAVTDPHFPVVLGGTYVSHKLGINNLKDVP